MQPQLKIQHSFHRSLRNYDDEAKAQKKIANRLLEYMAASELPDHFSRVLEFGCGTGFLTKPLLNQTTISELVVNDLVEECQDFLPLQRNDQHRITFLAGDIESIEIPNRCDLICSSSCIQWTRDLPTLLNKLGNHLNPGGWLAISSFSQDHFAEIESLTQRSDKQTLSYWSAAKWHAKLTADFEVSVIQQEPITQWFDSVRELLLHLRLTGVNGNAGQHWSQGKLAKFEREYRSRYERDGKVQLSYDPIYIVARKKTK